MDELSIVYVLTNPAMPGLVKIGRTDHEDANTRLDQLYTTGVPQPFRLEFACKVTNAGEVEAALHKAFAPYRVNPRREFFQIAPEQAIAILRLLHTADATTEFQQRMDEEERVVEAKKREEEALAEAARKVEEEALAEKRDREDFVNKLSTNQDSAEVDAARQVIAWADKQGLIPGWMPKGQVQVFRPFLRHGGKAIWPLSLDISGYLTIPMQVLTQQRPFSEATKQSELRERLNKILGMNLANNSPEAPVKIPLSALADGNAWHELFAAMNWLVDQIKEPSQMNSQ